MLNFIIIFDLFIRDFRKQFVESLIMSCPLTLYRSHLSPILTPILEHMQTRLYFTWNPILNGLSGATNALTSSTCESVVQLASNASDAWFKSYYARCCLFVGDADNVTAESAVEKSRVDITRVHIDMIQSALALRGDW